MNNTIHLRVIVMSLAFCVVLVANSLSSDSYTTSSLNYQSDHRPTFVELVECNLEDIQIEIEFWKGFDKPWFNSDKTISNEDFIRNILKEYVVVTEKEWGSMVMSLPGVGRYNGVIQMPGKSRGYWNLTYQGIVINFQSSKSKWITEYICLIREQHISTISYPEKQRP